MAATWPKKGRAQPRFRPLADAARLGMMPNCFLLIHLKSTMVASDHADDANNFFHVRTQLHKKQGAGEKRFLEVES
jgi:hypothetical protein